jgi:hypothetical protein
MKKVIKLTENDLLKIIKKVIEEQNFDKINVKNINQNEYKNNTSKYVDNTSVSVMGPNGIRKSTSTSPKLKQQSPTPLKINYSCLPNKNGMSEFVNYVAFNKSLIKSNLGVNDETLIFLTKIAIGIMGWQSTYGVKDRLYDMAGIKLFGLNPYDIYKDFDKIGKLLGYENLAANTIETTSKTLNLDEPSFGPAEFMPSTFNKTGVEKKYGYGFETIIGSGLAIMSTILDSYRTALKNGLGSSSSENEIAKLKGVPKWDNIKGTGNHLWDVAISTHTWPASKMLIKYCKTNRPDFAAPCNKTTYKPFNDETSWKSYITNQGNSSYYKKNPQLTKFPGEIKVISGQQIPNYYPYLTGAHGDYTGNQLDSKAIMEWVVNAMSKFSCINVAFK